MALETSARPHVLSGEEIVAMCRQYTLYDWTAQSAVDPIPVDHAKGAYFYTPDGKGIIDFNCRYRSYHGATARAIARAGDPGRWANDIGDSGVVHLLDPYHGPQRDFDTAAVSLRYLEETIQLKGPSTIASFVLEPITGTN